MSQAETRPTILLVEDEPLMRKMMALMLEKRGFKVLSASSGAEALALAAEHAIDMLVTDVVMDPMDGVELARALTQRRPQLPVVFVSGHPLDSRILRQFRRAVFLAKPFHAGELAAAVAQFSPGGSVPQEPPPPPI